MQTAKQVSEAQLNSAKNSVIDKSLLLRIDHHQNVPIYTSITCFLIAKLYKPLQRQHMILDAVRAFRNRDPRDGCGQKLRVLRSRNNKDYDFLWALQDEESIVLVFPEDL